MADDLSEAPTNLVALRDARQRAEALVAQRYGEDLIDADQLDRRMERIASATTIVQLEREIIDLVDPGTLPSQVLAGTLGRPSGSTALVSTRSPVALAIPSQVPAERTMTAIFSSFEGPGPGPLARVVKVNTLFGATKLDLREVEFGPGETEIRLQVAAGSIEIEVPKGLPVIVDASLLLAAVEREGPIPSGPRTPDEPHLRITGFVLLGSIELEERLPGESGREARKRRKRERKALKAEQKKMLNRGR